MINEIFDEDEKKLFKAGAILQDSDALQVNLYFKDKAIEMEMWTKEGNFTHYKWTSKK